MFLCIMLRLPGKYWKVHLSLQLTEEVQYIAARTEVPFPSITISVPVFSSYKGLADI